MSGKRKLNQEITSEEFQTKKLKRTETTKCKNNFPIETEINQQRIRTLYGSLQNPVNGPVVYWMSRDQRVEDNWAMIYSQQLVTSQTTSDNNHKIFPLAVVFNLVPSFLNATRRHYAFMFKGLQIVEQQLKDLNIPFFLLQGDPAETVYQFVKNYKVSHVVTDYSPLRINREWKNNFIKKISCNYKECVIHEVDSHNIVPVWVASTKQEVAARTLRPKIQKLLPTFLTEFPKLKNHQSNEIWQKEQIQRGIDWNQLFKWMDENVIEGTEIDWLQPGPNAALQTLQQFIDQKLQNYAEKRNDPNEDVLSNLSPYFHFGHLAPQRAALNVMSLRQKYPRSVDAFIEESVIRRELSDNFCHYNEHYDSFEGFPQWAQQTLKDHMNDKRTIIYSQNDLEYFRTYDNLWNACQLEMVRKGKMHGYMRMYWAKKILEWTPDPREALRLILFSLLKNVFETLQDSKENCFWWSYRFRIAIYLNDKYEIDGRDPNGYVGCAWAIGGVHDRAWPEREIFGKIRYMNYEGCKRKFNIKKYIDSCRQYLNNDEKAKFTDDLLPLQKSSENQTS